MVRRNTMLKNVFEDIVGAIVALFYALSFMLAGCATLNGAEDEGDRHTVVLPAELVSEFNFDPHPLVSEFNFDELDDSPELADELGQIKAFFGTSENRGYRVVVFPDIVFFYVIFQRPVDCYSYDELLTDAPEILGRDCETVYEGVMVKLWYERHRKGAFSSTSLTNIGFWMVNHGLVSMNGLTHSLLIVAADRLWHLRHSPDRCRTEVVVDYRPEEIESIVHKLSTKGNDDVLKYLMHEQVRLVLDIASARNKFLCGRAGDKFAEQDDWEGLILQLYGGWDKFYQD